MFFSKANLGLLVGALSAIGTPVLAQATSTATAPSTIVTPTPAQPGMIDGCHSFYLVQTNNTCNDITAKFDLDFNLFCKQSKPSQGEPRYPAELRIESLNCLCRLLENRPQGRVYVHRFEESSLTLRPQTDHWNPTVGDLCPTLILGDWVCIGVEGFAPNPTPTPIAPTTVAGCHTFYKIQPNDYCAKIVNEIDITLQEFYAWNPSIDAACGNLALDRWVCVGA